MVGGQTAYDSVVVTKPTSARSTKISGGATIVVVGDKAWMSKDDGKTFEPIPSSMIGPLTAGFGPELISGPFNGTVFAQGATDKGSEKKNGVDAHHFHIDSDHCGWQLFVLPARCDRRRLGGSRWVYRRGRDQGLHGNPGHPAPGDERQRQGQQGRAAELTGSAARGAEPSAIVRG